MFCLQIHARAECTMNKKFCILHKAAGTDFESIVHLASACICKRNANLAVSNIFNKKSEFTACARKQKPYAFTLAQNKIRV